MNFPKKCISVLLALAVVAGIGGKASAGDSTSSQAPSGTPSPQSTTTTTAPPLQSFLDWLLLLFSNPSTPRPSNTDDTGGPRTISSTRIQ
jgi:hypothetical protein